MTNMKRLWETTEDEAKDMLNQRELSEAYCLETLGNFHSTLQKASKDQLLELITDIKMMGLEDSDKMVFVEKALANKK